MIEPTGVVTEKSMRRPYSRMKHNLVGRVFGCWTVLALSSRRGSDYQVFWFCSCECGVERDVNGNQLRRGKSLSCGCQGRERHRAAVTKHGHAKDGARDRTYSSWQHMKQRCLNPGDDAYHHYGGRGISIDPRWIDSFETFLADMGPCPAGYTIERNDVNGDYESSNCRWATQKEQMQNTRVVRVLTLGNETLNVSQWATRLGINRGTLFKRLASGWSDTETLTLPVDCRYSRTRR